MGYAEGDGPVVWGDCAEYLLSFKRIFASGELDAQTVNKEILITAQSGVRGVSEEKIRYYNLDAILSLGYRVNSV